MNIAGDVCCVLQSGMVSTKDWILQYAACQIDDDDDDDDDDELVNDNGEEEISIPTCEEADINSDPVTILFFPHYRTATAVSVIIRMFIHHKDR